MSIGLSTYAYLWRLRAPEPLRVTLHGIVDDCARLGADMIQLCDYPEILEMPRRQLLDLKAHAVQSGIAIELGTRGVDAKTIDRWLSLALFFDARLLRSMVNRRGHQPESAEAESLLRSRVKQLDAQGVTLALETYEQVPTERLCAIVEAVASPRVGVCLDPANTVAALEQPCAVVERAAALTVNVHVKDFVYARGPDQIGFAVHGALLGTGLLDYPHLLEHARPVERGLTQVVEHWLPWQGNWEATCSLESKWTTANTEHIRHWRHA